MDRSTIALVNFCRTTLAWIGVLPALIVIVCQPSKINRIMLGQSKVSPGDAKMLGELYGASPELVEVMVDLARNLGQKGNWTSYRDVYSESLRLLLDLEHYSNRIRQVQSEIIPGLLQT